MRVLCLLLIIGLLTSCNQTTVKPSDRSETSAVTEVVAITGESNKDKALNFLLSAAAKDFMTHTPPEPLKFRGVNSGQMINPDKSVLYILCGEFMVETAEAQFEWVDFATLITHGYEQWLGSQAKGLCQQPDIVWDAGDLSALLFANTAVFKY